MLVVRVMMNVTVAMDMRGAERLLSRSVIVRFETIRMSVPERRHVAAGEQQYG